MLSYQLHAIFHYQQTNISLYLVSSHQSHQALTSHVYWSTYFVNTLGPSSDKLLARSHVCDFLTLSLERGISDFHPP